MENYTPFDIAKTGRDGIKHNYFGHYNPEEFWKHYGKVYVRLFKFPGKDGKQAEGYDSMLLNVPAAVSRINFIEPKSLLEVGCGFGRCLAPIHFNIKGLERVVGLELSPTMIESSKEFLNGYYKVESVKDKSINIIQGNAKNLPFKDDEFDVVFTHVSLTHIPPEDIPQVTSEISRVAKSWIIHIERFSYEYEHPNPHRWSHLLPPFYLEKGWKLHEYDTISENPEHFTKILVMKR